MSGGGGHTGPIDFWALDGVARDYGWFENHGTLEGDSTFSDDVPPAVGVGKSLSFDGDGDYVYLGTDLLDGERFEEFTFQAWFKTSAVTDPIHATIFSTETTDGEVNVMLDADGTLHCLVYTENEGGQSLYGPVVTDDQWHHISLRKDTAEIALFLDGIELDSLPASGPLQVNGVWHATIACKYTDDPAHFFQGLIDEVKIHDHALTDERIAADAGLVGVWKLDECDGDVAVDSGARHLDGTIFGASWTETGCALDDGCALEFDEDRVQIGDNLLGGRQFNEFTCQAWFKTDGAFEPNWIRGTILKNESSDGEFHLGVQREDGTLRSIAYTENEGGISLYGPVVTDNECHHVAMRKNGTELALYLDGILVDSQPATGPLQVNGLWRFTIGTGHTNDPPTQNFKGLIDDVRVYEYPRSDEQIMFDAGL